MEATEEVATASEMETVLEIRSIFNGLSQKVYCTGEGGVDRITEALQSNDEAWVFVHYSDGRVLEVASANCEIMRHPVQRPKVVLPF